MRNRYRWGKYFFAYSIASTLIKNSSDKVYEYSKGLPSFIGVMQVKHYIPGRIRLYVPSIKNNEHMSLEMINTLKKIPAIQDVSANVNICSVLVKYDSNNMDATLVMGIMLKILGLENKVKEKPVSLILKEVNNIQDSVNLAIYEKTHGILDLNSILFLGLSGMGAYRAKNCPQIQTCGFTNLWWAYSLIKK